MNDAGPNTEILAIKQQFDYINADTYERFLQQHLFEINPIYYLVTNYKKVLTKSGLMVAMTIDRSDLSNPNFTPIAECFINNLTLYLWKNRCWTIALNGITKLPIIRVSNRDVNDDRRHAIPSTNCSRKSLLLYPLVESNLIEKLENQ